MGLTKGVLALLAARGRAAGMPMLHQEVVVSVAFSPRGDRLLTGSQDWKVRVWDAARGKELYRLPRVGHVSYAAFSPNGDRLLTGSQDKSARLWDAEGNELRKLVHDGPVLRVAFSPRDDL